MRRSNFMLAAGAAALLGLASAQVKAMPEAICTEQASGVVCQMQLLDNLALEYAAEQSDTSNPDRMELTGEVTFIAQNTRLPLYETHLVIAQNDQDAPELYGVAKLPLDQLPVLKDANIERVPLMTIGLMQGDTIEEMLGSALPLNNATAFDGSKRSGNQPYLMFYADAGLALNVDLGNQSPDGGELTLTVPGSTSATFIFDINDPYFYLSYESTDGLSSDDDKKASTGMPIDAVGFSTHGWIGFEAQSTFGIPTKAQQFPSQLYMHGTVPLGGPVSLTGDVYTYVRENAFAIGGNGDVSVGFPGLPAGIDLNFLLGSATAAMIVSDEIKTTYFSGELKPDTSILDDILPLKPKAGALAAGYIDSELIDSHVSLKGQFGMDMSMISGLLGVQLNDLAMTEVNAHIDMQGVHINGQTRTQLHPDIDFGSDMLVEAYVDWVQPEAFSIKLIGNIDVFGVGLENAFIEINARGVFVNGAFVTPLSSIGLSGSITDRGPSLTGAASITLGLGGLTQAMADATATLNAAQREVNRLNSAISNMRKVVQRERDQHQAKLAAARSALTTAQNAVNSLNSKIASENRAISKRKSEIASWKRWLNKAKWYEAAYRAGRYAYEAGWRSTEIAGRYVAIAGLTASKATATLGLNIAKESLRALENAIDVFPIDLDPRVAGLITAKTAANIALEAAKLPLQNIPIVSGDFSAEMDLTLGFSGLGGSVSAQFDGNTLLEGRVVFSNQPKACIYLPGLGDACTSF